MKKQTNKQICNSQKACVNSFKAQNNKSMQEPRTANTCKYKHTYIHTLLRLPSTGLFSHNINYYIILVIKKRKENLSTVVQLNSKYIQNYSKYIQNYFVWNILLKSLRLKLSISLVFLILSGSPFHSFGPRK